MAPRREAHAFFEKVVVLGDNRPERRRAVRHPPERPLVLIVDGDADTRDLYCTALASADCETDAIADVADAYMRAWTTHPDVIAMEIWRAGEPAWTVIQDLKRDPRTRDIPLVIVTSLTHPAAHERAAHEGCAAFLTKPCRPDVLATTLRDVVAMQCENRHNSHGSICQHVS